MLWVFLLSSASLAAAPAVDSRSIPRAPPVKVTRAIVSTSLNSHYEPRSPAQVLGIPSRAYYYVEASGFVPQRTYQVHLTVADGAGNRVGDYRFRTRSRQDQHAIWHVFGLGAAQAPGVWTLRLELDDQLAAETRVQVDAAANRGTGKGLERYWPAVAAGLLLTLLYIGWSIATAPRALPDAALPAQSASGAIDPALAAVILANLFPLALVLFAHANAPDLLLLYWCDNLVVGAYAILRMLTVQQAFPAAIALVPFFVFHFGLFTFVHYALLVGFFGDEISLVVFSPQGFHPTSPVQFLKDPLDFFEEPPVALALQIAVLSMTQGIAFAHNYIRRGEYLSSNVIWEMLRPYPRLIAMHVALIIGGLAALWLGSSIAVLIVLIALKMGFDVYAHTRSRAGAPAFLAQFQ